MHFTCAFEIVMGGGATVTAVPRSPYISAGSHTMCNPPCRNMTNGLHVVTLSSSPQNKKHLQQAPWFCRVVRGGLVWVWVAFAWFFSYFS